MRRGGRAVERGGLENRYTFTGIGGSNPPLSAMGKQKAEGRRQRVEVSFADHFRVAVHCQIGSRCKVPGRIHFCLLLSAFCPSRERWPSGLRRTLGKRVYVNPYRGFESHSLRQLRNWSDQPSAGMSPGPVQQARRTSSGPEGSSDKVHPLCAAVNLGSSERLATF